jgi:hypothetical protein
MNFDPFLVIPAQAGTQRAARIAAATWTPALAGVTIIQ